MLFEGGDVFGGGDSGLLTSFEGVVFGGEAEGIPAHGMKNIFSSHSHHAGIDVGGDIAFGVADMKSSTARIGEHVENIELFFSKIVGSEVGLILGPFLLPFFLEL